MIVILLKGKIVGMGMGMEMGMEMGTGIAWQTFHPHRVVWSVLS